jgi:hypothetical protein
VSAGGIESLAALVAATVAALIANAHLLRSDVVEGDALVHLYWMRSFADPALFSDPLTEALRHSERYPAGYVALFRVASQLVDPISFGEWLGVALMASSGWLIFAIVREHTAWAPAAWISGALFVALDGHRFYGGFPRGFVQVIVLLTVLLSLRRRCLAAALVAAAGALVYPPAALLSVGTLMASSVGFRGRRPRLDAERARFALLALVLAAVAVAGTATLSDASPGFMTADQARAYPEFGPHGELHYFVPSTIEYLRQNRSGFDLRATGSLLALVALALLVVGRSNVRLLRAEVLALPIVALAGYGLAQAVLFKLYLPHRYTYPLVAFFAIVVGVTLRPTWQALWTRPRPRARAFALLAAPFALTLLAIYVFPLGPVRPRQDLATWTAIASAALSLAVAGAAAMVIDRAPRTRRAALGALLTGLTLVGLVLAAPGRRPPGQLCPQTPAANYLASLPKDAVIAGDPIDLKCVPQTARRAVVISTQLAPSYEAAYFRNTRARMFAMLRAYYGPSRGAITALHARYGATHIWIRRGAIGRERTARAARWPNWEQPYGAFVRQLLSSGEPAVLHLPRRCRRWTHGREEVYDIACIRG